VLGARRGASLIELLVALALFGVVGAATLRSLDRQSRFHRGVLAILESRAQHAAAHEAVAVELRSAAASSGDIDRLSDSAIVFRLPVASGVACAVGGGAIDLAPDTAAVGQSFARARTAPQAGDTAWVFDEGPTDVLADDSWLAVALTSVSRSSGRCIGSPLVDPVLDAAAATWRLYHAGALPATIVAGAPVRLTRPARFALYRSGAESWLGYAEWQPVSGAWVTIQPVSGPYLAYSVAAPSTSGIALAARDSSGGAVALPGPARVAMIALATRTLTTQRVRMDGVVHGRYSDSLFSLIALRNAR
jgi:prepilin-type N-terminal cleavage/methylation domain-containing protein